MKDIPAEPIAMIFYNRGVTKMRLGFIKEAVANLTVVIDMMEYVPAEVVANVLNNRGRAKALLGDIEGAIADFTAVIDMENSPAEVVARALEIRGIIEEHLN